jgi:hypothetical protein
MDRYGCEAQPNPNGMNLYIPAESAEAIADELRARGHHVAESIDDLPDWIVHVYG